MCATKYSKAEATGELIRRGLHLCGALNGWPETAMEQLATGSRLQHFTKGSVVMHAGSDRRDALVVVSGSVEIGGVDSDGARFVLTMRGAGEIIGIARMLRDRKFVYTYRASEDAVLVFLPANVLETVLDAHPPLWRTLCMLMLDRMCDQIELSKRWAFSLPSFRVADTLLRLCAQHGMHSTHDGHLHLRISQTDLAAMLAVSRQTVNKELRLLEQKGALDSGYGELRILDINKLREICDAPRYL